MEILSITTNISRYGGAQKVMLDLHRGLSEEFNCKILSLQSFKKIHKKYKIDQNEFVRFRNPFVLQNKVLIIHARNILPFFVLLKKMFFLNTKIIYVSHNVYSSFRYLTIFPENIISISNKVTDNLINYFGVESKKISLIYNGLEDYGQYYNPYYNNHKIRILYPARINSVKRQLELVNALKNRLSDRIEICFAGVGEDFEELTKVCDGKQFKALGFITDMNELIKSFDYLMLYSKQEGLPLSLIEGLMHSKPLLVNDVGGNLELGIPNYNGFQLSDNFNDIFIELNNLLNINSSLYEEMARNSRRLYLKNFKYETMVTKYKELIRNLS